MWGYRRWLVVLVLLMATGKVWWCDDFIGNPALTPAQQAALQQNSRPLLAALITKPPTPDDWPQDRHDARNTGLSADQIAPPLRLLWKVPGFYRGSYMMSSGGVVAVTQVTGEKRRTGETALYDKTGRCVWKLANAVLYYIKDSRIVAGVRTERVSGTTEYESVTACYDWRTNKVLWSQPKPSHIGAVIAQDGRLYMARHWNDLAVLWMLDLETGQVLQECHIHDLTGGDLACDGEHLYWSTCQWMHVLDARSLERQWAYYGTAKISPIPVGSLLIAQGGGHETCTLDLKAKKSTWGVRSWRGSAHALAVGAGGQQVLIEAIPLPEHVAAFDLITGKVLWRHPLIVTTNSDTPAAGSGHFVYIPGCHRLPGWNKQIDDHVGIRGGFYCLDAVTGKLRWKYEKLGIQGRSIIVSEGRVYGLDSDGTLYCFAPSSAH